MNMRKIIAILAAAMMLCATIPMAALSVTAAPGDVALEANFDNGLDGFQSDVSLSADGGYLTFDAPGASWVTAYAYCGNLKADTYYKVTFSAKANKDAQLGFVIKNGWPTELFKEFVDVTTEWQDYTITMSNLALTEQALVMFLSNYEAADAPIFNIDDVKIVEVADPALIGKLINGDFENGDNTGWETLQSTTIDAESAYTGSYGAHLIGDGSWGGLLDQAVIANPGKSYEISFWLKANATGVSFKIQDGNWEGAVLDSKWFDIDNIGTEWNQYTFIVTAASDIIYLNFCGSGEAAEDIYVDDITCVELKEPSFDGYIYNGDFEVGKADFWDTVWTEWADNISIVEGGYNSDYALQANHGMYQLVRQAVNVKPNTNYVVSVYNKNASNMTLLVKSCPADANITQTALTGEGDEWTKTSLEFNSGDNSQVYIAIMGNVEGSTAVVDDFYMVEKSNDGYIVNGNFETGELDPWEKIWDSQVDAEIITDGHDSAFGAKVTGKAPWGQLRQKITVEPNTNYKVTVWAKDVNNMSLLVKDGADQVNMVNEGIHAGSEWTEVSATFNSGDNTSVYVSVMVNDAASYGTFDDFQVKKLKDPSFDGYIYNGDFETGEAPSSAMNTGVVTDAWYSLYSSNIVTLVEGYEGDYALSIVTPGQWNQVRQDKIAVEPNSTYRLSAWVKNAQNMGFVIKTGDDTTDLTKFETGAFPADEDWQLFTMEFNIGVDKNGNAIDPIDSICILVISGDGAANGSVIIDNITLEKVEEPVVEIMYGDVNGDDAIDILDEALVSQYVNGWPVDLNEAAADVNGDDAIDILDEALVSQYVNGWPVDLGPN